MLQDFLFCCDKYAQLTTWMPTITEMVIPAKSNPNSHISQNHTPVQDTTFLSEVVAPVKLHAASTGFPEVHL